MRYVLNLTGFEGQTIEVQSPNIFSGPRLFVNGAKVNVDKKSRSMLLQRNDGTKVNCKWKQKTFGLDVPALDMGGEEVQVAKPLHWAIWVWCAIPIVLLFVGGALGALLGVIGSGVNLLVIRSSNNLIAKIALTTVVTVLAYAGWFVGAVALQMALRK